MSIGVATYYCDICDPMRPEALESTGTLFATTYQQRKVADHTSPLTLRRGPHSVFASGVDYESVTSDTVLKGFAEIDGLGRYNIIWAGGFASGIKYDNSGKTSTPTNAVKVVKPTNPTGIHSFTVDLPRTIRNCVMCGRSL